MSFLNVVILGLVQGITEFLPVSSSGHLAIAKALLGIDEPGLLLDVLLHFGTLIAICVVYWKDIVRLIVAFFQMVLDCFVNAGVFFQRNVLKRIVSYRKIVDSGYKRFVVMVIVSTIPTGIIGVLDKDFVELAGTFLIIPGVGLIITGIVLIIADRVKGGNKLPKSISYSNSFIVGIAQGVATLPGISRSGSTLACCLGLGFDRTFAVKYCFIMSIPAVLGSVVFEIADVGKEVLAGGEIAKYALGMIVSAVVGYVCIKTMLLIVRKKRLWGFSVYCFIIGAVSIIAWYLDHAGMISIS